MRDALFSLLEVTLSVGAVIALLLALGPLLEKRFKPQWRYWAWLAVAVRLAVPFNLPSPQPLVQIPAPVMEQRGESPRNAPSSLTGPGGENAVPAVNINPVDTPVQPQASAAAPAAAPIRIPWTVLLPALWLGGGGVFLAAQLWGYSRFRRTIRRWGRSPGEEERAVLAEAMAQAGVTAPVELIVCRAVTSPALVGFLRPAILLPETLEGDALPFALLHELTHLKRRDLWYKALLVWANALHWFNPLVWLMRRRAEQDLEAACDDALLRGRDEAYRRSYGAAILSAVTTQRQSAAALTSHFAADGKSLKKRVLALLDMGPKHKGRAALAVVVCAAVLASALVACREQAAVLPDGTYWAEPQLSAEESALLREKGYAETVTFALADVDESGDFPVQISTEENTHTLDLAEDAALSLRALNGRSEAFGGSVNDFIQYRLLLSYAPVLLHLQVQGGTITAMEWVWGNYAPEYLWSNHSGTVTGLMGQFTQENGENTYSGMAYHRDANTLTFQPVERYLGTDGKEYAASWGEMGGEATQVRGLGAAVTLPLTEDAVVVGSNGTETGPEGMEELCFGLLAMSYTPYHFLRMEVEDGRVRRVESVREVRLSTEDAALGDWLGGLADGALGDTPDGWDDIDWKAFTELMKGSSIRENLRSLDDITDAMMSGETVIGSYCNESNSYWLTQGYTNSFGSFTGVIHQYTIDTDRDMEVQLIYSTDFPADEFKAAIVTANGEVQYLEHSRTDKTVTISLPEGNNFVAMAGFRAGGTFRIRMTPQDGAELRYRDEFMEAFSQAGSWNTQGGEGPTLVNEQSMDMSGVKLVSVDYIMENVVFYQGESDKLVYREYLTRNDSSCLGKAERKDGALTIKTGERPKDGTWQSGYVEIYLPASYAGSLNVETTSGNITVPVLNGGDAISSVSGNLSAAAANGVQRLETTSGNITLESAALKAGSTINSVSGDIRVGQMTGAPYIGTTSGNITVERMEGYGEYTTTSGGIDLTYLAVKGDISVSSTSGTVRLGLPVGLGMDFDARSNSGSIHTPFDGELTVRKRSKSGSVSGGGVSVQIVTTSGDITVSQT